MYPEAYAAHSLKYLVLAYGALADLRSVGAGGYGAAFVNGETQGACGVLTAYTGHGTTSSHEESHPDGREYVQVHLDLPVCEANI